MLENRCDCKAKNEDLIQKVKDQLPDFNTIMELSDFLKVMADSTRLQLLMSLQQSEIRIYLAPLLPKINPGVINTLASCSTFSVSSSTSLQEAGIFPQRNMPTCFSS